jgi:hypothetical protein
MKKLLWEIYDNMYKFGRKELSVYMREVHKIKRLWANEIIQFIAK